MRILLQQVAACLLLLVQAKTRSVQAVALGEKCWSHDGCSTAIAQSWCYIASPTCGSGYCSCMPGFVASQNGTGQCLGTKRIGQSCGPRDVCLDPNTECTYGVCSCISGFVQSPETGFCMSPMKRSAAGELCFDSTQCVGNLVCVNNICGCYDEYSLYGCCDCVSKRQGESCSVDSDCNYAANTLCVSGRCACGPTSVLVGYISMSTLKQSQYEMVESMGPKCSTRRACVSKSYRFAVEGEACSEPAANDVTKSYKLCEMPLVCTSCGGNRNVCARTPTACYLVIADSAPSHALLTSTLTAALIASSALIARISL